MLVEFNVVLLQTMNWIFHEGITLWWKSEKWQLTALFWFWRIDQLSVRLSSQVRSIVTPLKGAFMDVMVTERMESMALGRNRGRRVRTEENVLGGLDGDERFTIEHFNSVRDENSLG